MLYTEECPSRGHRIGLEEKPHNLSESNPDGPWHTQEQHSEKLASPTQARNKQHGLKNMHQDQNRSMMSAARTAAEQVTS